MLIMLVEFPSDMGKMGRSKQPGAWEKDRGKETFPGIRPLQLSGVSWPCLWWLWIEINEMQVSTFDSQYVGTFFEKSCFY